MATIVERRNREGELIGWQAKVRRRGFEPQSRTFVRKADAERWARQIEYEMEEGIFTSRTEAERNTLGDLVRRYVKEITPSHKGALQEELRLNAMLKDAICLRSVATLRSSDFSEWRDARLQTVSAATVVREMNIWHAVIEMARREWGVHLANNPVGLVRRPRVGLARERRLEGDEEQRLLGACDSDSDPWLGAIVRVAIETGMRQGELCGLRWRDVDLTKTVAILRETKNGEMRVVPLSSVAKEVLRNLPKSVSGEVFPVDQNALKMRFRRACARAGIEGLRFHDLRHEATSRFFERGLGVMEVAAITGHKTLQMLKRYTHVQAQHLAAKLG